MKIRNFSIAFSIFVGIGIPSTWIVLLTTGNVPELQSKPIETSFLLLAEFLTASFMLLASYGLLRRQSWGTALELFALGMLLYCSIYSTGSFGQQNNIPATIFFVIITLVDAVIFGSMFTQYLTSPSNSSETFPISQSQDL